MRLPRPRREKARHRSHHRRLVVEGLEHRRVLAAYINEFHFSPLFGSEDQDQFIEIRGEANGTLDAGTYFVGIESADGVNELGDIHSIFDLSGQSFGANGLLVLLQSGNGYAVDSTANVLTGSDGFQGIGGGIFQADNFAGQPRKGVHTGSSTYLLIQSATAPSLTDDIDSNDDGVPDGAYENWTILDGFSTLLWGESVWTQRTYAPIVFTEDGVGDSNLPDATVIVTDQQAYAGRIGNSVGYSPEEWLTGNTVEKDTDQFNFQFQHGTFGAPRPYAFGGRILDHIGAPNWFGTISGTIFADLNADGIQQAGEANLDGAEIIVGETFNQPFVWEQIEPDDYPLDTELSNISKNVTLVTAGTNNVPLGFKATAVQLPQGGAGQHVFSHAGVNFFNETRRLRMDFYRPARAVMIDVIGNSNSTPTYGRLEIFNKQNESLGWVRTQPLAAGQRQTLSISSAGDDIAWALAYPENSYLNSSTVGRLDALRVEVQQSSTVSNVGGNFVVAANEGNYTVSVKAPDRFYQVSPEGNGSRAVTLAESGFVTGVNFGFQPYAGPSLANQNASVGELATAGTVVLGLPVQLGYPTQKLEFTIVAGDDQNQFAIDPQTFELSVANGDLDFESASAYSLLVQVRDADIPEFVTEAQVQIVVQDQNEAPAVTPEQSILNENSQTSAAIATMVATDPDAGTAGSLTWSIVDGNSDGAFAIDPTSGEVRIANPAAIDFEQHPSFSLVVRATDAGTPSKFGQAILLVTLVDLNERPLITSPAFSIAENSAADTLVGQLTYTDPDAGQTISWSVLGGDGQAAFDVAADGRITVKPNANLDFESQATYMLEVQATDDGNPNLADTRSVTITVSDLNDSPIFLPQSLAVDENSPADTVVGTVSGSDQDAGQSLTYAITGGDLASNFEINPATGEIKVAAAATLDFESNPEITIEVTVTDDAANPQSTSALVTISLVDVNDPPRLDSGSFSVAENSNPGTVVGIVSAEDPDAGETLQFELVEQTFPWLAIDPSSGELRVANGAVIDFEAQSQNSITVKVTDSKGLSDQVVMPVVATDTNDPPLLVQPILDLSAQVGELFSFTIPEGSFSDQDAGDTLRFVATTASGFSLPAWLAFDSSTRTFSGTPTASDLGNLSLKLTALDSGNAFIIDEFDIDVQLPPKPWHNSRDAEDVTDDGLISPLDSLRVINYLNSGEPSQVPPGAAAVHGLIDVNGDNFVTPLDVLLVINRLNDGNANGEGELSRLASADLSFLSDGDREEQRALDELYSLLAVDRLQSP
jgi:VCBS repeat-containing protein